MHGAGALPTKVGIEPLGGFFAQREPAKASTPADSNRNFKGAKFRLRSELPTFEFEKEKPFAYHSNEIETPGDTL